MKILKEDDNLVLALDNNVIYTLMPFNNKNILTGKLGSYHVNEFEKSILREGLYRFYIGKYNVWLSKESISDIEYFPSDIELENLPVVNEDIFKYWFILLEYDQFEIIFESIKDIIPNGDYYIKRDRDGKMIFYVKELTDEIRVIVKLLGHHHDFIQPLE